MNERGGHPPEDPSPPEQWPSESAAVWQRTAAVSTTGLLVLGIGYALFAAQAVVLPVCLAIFLSVLLAPGVQLLARARIPSSIGAAIVLLAFCGVVGVAAYHLAAPAGEWMSRAPEALAEARGTFRAITLTVAKVKETTEKIEDATDTDTGDGANLEVEVSGPSLLRRLLDFTFGTFGALVVTLSLIYFMLSMGGKTVSRVVACLAERRREAAVAFIGNFRKRVSMYLQTLALINLCLGLATAGAMALLGMPDALLWGALAGILSFIPYLGPLVTLTVIGLAALLTFDTWIGILAPVLAYGVITTIEGQFITPTLVGKRLMLNPIAVFIACWVASPCGGSSARSLPFRCSPRSRSPASRSRRCFPSRSRWAMARTTPRLLEWGVSPVPDDAISLP